MTELRELFERTRSENRAALIPYLTAGDPGLSETVDFAEALVEGGSDLLEIGVPFSDPLADGPVIQRASERALLAGTRLGDVLECAARIRDRTGVPLVIMTYLNPVLRFGWDRFTREARAAGVIGTILTDVPPEESASFLPAAETEGLGTVFLVAPTSDADRIRRVIEVTTGFVYCVSRLGVTGEREGLSDSFRPVLEQVRSMSDIPVGLGFGISTPDQAREAGALADGVIVGSALVALVERARTIRRAAGELRETARALRHALEAARSA